MIASKHVVLLISASTSKMEQYCYLDTKYPLKQKMSLAKVLIIITTALAFTLLVLGGILIFFMLNPNFNLDNSFNKSTTKRSLFDEKFPWFYKLDDWSIDSLAPNLTLFSSTPSWIVIGHTATKFCNTTLQCATAVQSIRNYHKKINSTEIKYNFVIGGDGSIYEGRGWHYHPFGYMKAIFVSFVGNFVYDELNEEMKQALENLITTGIRFNWLSVNFKIVCHNQTVPTISPGEHIFKVIQNWEHYRPGSFIASMD